MDEIDPMQISSKRGSSTDVMSANSNDVSGDIMDIDSFSTDPNLNNDINVIDCNMDNVEDQKSEIKDDEQTQLVIGSMVEYKKGKSRGKGKQALVSNIRSIKDKVYYRLNSYRFGGHLGCSFLLFSTKNERKKFSDN